MHIIRLCLSMLVLTIVAPSLSLSEEPKAPKYKRNVSLVSVYKARVINTSEKTQIIGRLVALGPTVITADVAQEVLQKHVKIGEDVTKGQLLITLKSTDIKRSIKRLKAEKFLEEKSSNLLRQQLRLRKAKVERAKGLRDKKALSQDSFETTKILFLQVQQQLMQRKYNIEKINLLLEESLEDLSATQIIAPVSGNIIEVDAQIGIILKEGQKVASIFVPSASEIEANLRTDVASLVQTGSEVQIKFGDQRFSGQLRALVKVENTRTGTRVARIQVVETLPSSIGVIGTRFMLDIPIGVASPKLLVPKDALVPSGEKQIIFVFEKGFAKRRNVVLGASIGELIEIKKGINSGEMVIIRGNEGIRSNQPVRLKNNLRKKRNKKFSLKNKLNL